MAEFKLGRIKFVWKNEWASSSTYYVDDVVRYGGKTYICVVGHQSDASFYTDLNAVPTKWNLMSDGSDWKNNWNTSTFYKIGDLVKYGGNIYICSVPHTSAATNALGLETDFPANWNIFAEGFDWKGDWTISTRYKPNDLVRYGGYTYFCNTGHTSASTTTLGLENNSGFWDDFNPGFEYKGAWNGSSVRYKENDIVKYGSALFIATAGHTSVGDFNSGSWNILVEGMQFEDDWNVSSTYQPGDMVTYGGYTYIAKTVNTGNTPSTSTANWDLINRGFKLIGDWSSVTSYKTGEVVRLNGYTYLCTTDHSNQVPPNLTYWQRLNSGLKWLGPWVDDFTYHLGDVVRYGANTYICVLGHTSEGDDGSTIPTNKPDVDISGTYWNIFVVGDETAVLTTRGDMVYFSNVGPTRLPIGEEGQILKVNSSSDPSWSYYGVITDVYYVAEDGVDIPSPVRGRTIDTPWKTIRYATEQILKGVHYPEAQQLLELNRPFLQKEVIQWITWQIANAGGSGIWNGFTYNSTKCERDVGFLVDRIIHDMGHGGNLKMRSAVQTYLNVLDDGPYSTLDDSNGTGPYTVLSSEYDNDVAAFNYLGTLIENILDQVAPAINYQVLNSVPSPVSQYINASLEAETGSKDRASELLDIVIEPINAQDPTLIPDRIIPNQTIMLKTGLFYETLPIIVPAETSVVGDELRSARVSPAGSLIDKSDSYYTVTTFDHVADIVSKIVQGTSVTPTSGNIEVQSASVPLASATEGSTVSTLVNVMKHQADYFINSMDSAYLTDPSNYNTSYLIGYGDARKLVRENKKFFQEEVLKFMETNYPTLKYSKTLTKRDVGFIVDAVVYDLTYGGNALSVKAGLAYYDGDDDTQPQLAASVKSAVLSSLVHLQSIMEDVALNTTISPYQTAIPQYRDTAGSAGAAAFVIARIDDIIDIIDGGPAVVGVSVTLTDPSTSWVAGGLTSAYSALSGAFTTIKNNVDTYLTTNYPGLLSVAERNKAKRDTEIVLKAVGYDFMFDTNYQSLKAAHAYLRPTANELYATDTDIKEATRNSLEYARTQAIANVNSDATAISRINASMAIVDAVFFGGSNNGDICQTETANNYNAMTQLERNRNFIVAEVQAYIENTFSDTATNTTVTTNRITISDTSWLRRNVAIRFSGTTFGNISTNTTYYVQKIVSSTQFTVSLNRDAVDGEQVVLSTASGTMTVSLYYNESLCLRDVHTYIDALKYDLKYVGNYKSRYVARYYVNAVTGSQEEDMYYVRNGTGVRNQTLLGLNGQLNPPNEYGTSRTTAGAYVSLDPGYGPDDFTTWIVARSPYVQNVTTFGNGAIGQKIDGALHNGGNDSIVSNDFTQVISDGIGAWVTNNGRAELVSVFTYYSHVGYLSENGGKIRGTNGNNSYGDFGAVAEGVDSTETPNTAVVDNQSQFEATVANVFTDQTSLRRLEFTNAGSHYTEATWDIFGAGTGASIEQDEFRDGAVFQVRLLDFGDDSSGQFGGEGYMYKANTAQSGTTTEISIAATDSELSTAYVGMKIYLVAGTGVGQFAIIDTYNSGSKVATLLKESTGTAGWDHIVAGTSIVAPDASTQYVIEPRISFTAPSYSSTARTLATSLQYVDAFYAETTKTYAAVSATGGAGSSATFNVTRRGPNYIVVDIVSGGTNYARLDTLTIAGTSLDGTSTTNDLSIVVTRVNSTTGAIQAIDYTGSGAGGNFVALATGTNTVNTSDNGTSWTARTAVLPSSTTWTALASGKLTVTENAGSFVTGRSYTITSLGNTNWVAAGAASATLGLTFIAANAGTGSGTAKPNQQVVVAVASGGTTNAYSRDGGVTWTAGGALPASATWTAIAYGQGRWIAIASGGTDSAYSTNGGVTWTAGGALPASATWTDIAYGQGRWVAVASGGTQAAYSTDGGVTWTGATLSASSNWQSVAFGNSRFVAVSNTSGTVASYSLDGVSWVASTLPATASWTRIRYGQGVFLAVSQSTQAASSEDGIVWTSRTMSTAANGFSSAVFGNPNRSGIWAAVQRSTAGTVASSTLLGATTRARVGVADEKIFEIRIVEPGSGYTVAPTMTITDPNNIYEAPFTVRIGNGALGNPSFLNRGTGYTASSVEMATGDGYGDFFQNGSIIGVKRLTDEPIPGSNVSFASIPGQVYKLVSVTSFVGSGPGDYSAFFTISPAISISDAPAHLDGVSTRIRYSQVRLTGHDFLNIGTGNFTNTNYPNEPLTAPNKEYEVNEYNGGRVFFTATDQDGNFNVGNLFTVEQSTGIATLNADAFSIAGLQELTLGSVSLGGASATITEFSTDTFFTADSDTIIPTQRAIKAYITSQIGGGGGSLNVNTLTAGSIFVAGNTITTTGGQAINLNARFDFRAGVTGYPLAYSYFFT